MMTSEEIAKVAVKLNCKVEDIQTLYDKIWQEAKVFYFSILGARVERRLGKKEMPK